MRKDPGFLLDSFSARKSCVIRSFTILLYLTVSSFSIRGTKPNLLFQLICKPKTRAILLKSNINRHIYTEDFKASWFSVFLLKPFPFNPSQVVLVRRLRALSLSVNYDKAFRNRIQADQFYLPSKVNIFHLIPHKVYLRSIIIYYVRCSVLIAIHISIPVPLSKYLAANKNAKTGFAAVAYHHHP